LAILGAVDAIQPDYFLFLRVGQNRDGIPICDMNAFRLKINITGDEFGVEISMD
jgi:hypothetical protein